MVTYDPTLEAPTRDFLARFERGLGSYTRLNPWSQFRWSEQPDRFGRPWLILTDSEGNGWFSTPTMLLVTLTVDRLLRDMKATELTNWHSMGSPLVTQAQHHRIALAEPSI